MDNDLIVTLDNLGPVTYKGSVQNITRVDLPQGEFMVCETTAAGSVFDVGSIFAIPGSDISRAAVRHHIFSQLHDPATWQRHTPAFREKYGHHADLMALVEEHALGPFRSHGAATHHVGMVERATGRVVRHGFPDPVSPFVLVRRFPVHRPQRVSLLNHHPWDYSVFRKQHHYVVPLENIVRLGITSGSSIYKKSQRLAGEERERYLRELGVADLLPWRMLPAPIVDFTSKYEPEDRALVLQEALHLSGLDGESFKRLFAMIIAGSWLVAEIFAELGLTLWDIKWEVAREGDNLLFVDTIDTDSLRVTGRLLVEGRAHQVHYNKQAMRDYYHIRHPAWIAAIAEAKAEAQQQGVAFKGLLAQGQESGRFPRTPEVDPAFLDLQTRKFKAFLDHVQGRAPVADIREEMTRIAQEEMGYYRDRGDFEAFSRLTCEA